MTTVTVLRRVPPPIIGVCGVIPDRDFEAFEQNLDWLEAIGVIVERIDPLEQPEEAARFEAVRDFLASACRRRLPLVLVDGALVSAGVHPTRSQLARLVGRNRRRADLLATG